MKEFRFAKNSRLALITLLFVLVMLVSWVISPVFPTTEPKAAIFEEVWETVNDNFYDPNFNGVDWRAMGEKYKPQVMQAQSKRRRCGCD
jgi:carboxyl-terminal processing protease